MLTLINVVLVFSSTCLNIAVAGRFPESSWPVFFNRLFGGFVVGWLARDLYQ